MSKDYSKIYICLCLILTVILGLILLIYSNNSKTLKVGFFYGSNWDVPGTKQQEVMDRAIEIFHEKYPDIEVTYESGVPSSTYSNWLYSKILKGSEPDVYLVLSDDFENLASTGALKNLDDFLDKDEEITQKNFYDNTYKSGTYGNHQYALPYACNPMLMFVNKTILDREGIDVPKDDWTWSEFLYICNLVTKDTDQDGTTDQFGYCGYDWTNAVYSNGCTIFSEDGTSLNSKDEAMYQALRFMRRLKNINQGHNVTSEDFDLGKVLFQPLTFADYLTYMPYPWKIKKYSNFEWICIMMPAGVQGGNVSSMDVLNAGISSRTNKPVEAWEFLKILTTNEEIQTMMVEKTSSASPLKDVMVSENVLNFLDSENPGNSNIEFDIINNVIEGSVIEKKFSGYDDILKHVDSQMEDILETQDDTTVAYFKIKDEINELIDEKHENKY